MRCFKNWQSKRKVKELDKVSTIESNHLGLIVGHTRASPGAKNASSGMHEYTFWRDFVNEFFLDQLWHGVKVSVFFRDEGGIEGAVRMAVKSGCNALIELHSNAYNEQVSGCEVLCSSDQDLPGLNEQHFARLLAFRLNEVMGNRLRGDNGVKYIAKSGERGFFNLTRVIDRPSVLIEPFFIDNDQDFGRAMSVRPMLAEAIVQAFKQFKGLD